MEKSCIPLNIILKRYGAEHLITLKKNPYIDIWINMRTDGVSEIITFSLRCVANVLTTNIFITFVGLLKRQAPPPRSKNSLYSAMLHLENFLEWYTLKRQRIR